MFKIQKLELHSFKGETYTYNFQEGINYFKGSNSSGKTEFYLFLDFMLGASLHINNKPWYKDTLEKAYLEFSFDKIKYVIMRSLDNRFYSIDYADVDIDKRENIDLKTYRDKLNIIFSRNNEEMLLRIKKFTDETLTYRTFTMFNFLGEKRQGLTYDFLDKCSEQKYSLKLPALLNFIFNKNLEKISKLQIEINFLNQEIKKLEKSVLKYEYIKKQINLNLKKLDYDKEFNGNNISEIKDFIKSLRSMEPKKRSRKAINISNLEVAYNNLNEKIKNIENRESDARQVLKENERRKILIDSLNKILEETNEYSNLVEPIIQLTEELNVSISFSNYVIRDETLSKLRKQEEALKYEIKNNDIRFKMYEVDEKIKAISLIEEYMKDDIQNNTELLKNKKENLKSLKENLKKLQSDDDTTKINKFEKFMTEIYKSAEEISKVVKEDLNKEGFKITYIKKGNVLQPMHLVEDKNNEKKLMNYPVGSMARHTLLQLCGYLGFLKLLIEEKNYPIVPILVLDHISKPFDNDNRLAIGTIIESAYKEIEKNQLQIFIFDDKSPMELAAKVNHFEDLESEEKSGFNPFFFSNEKKNNK